MMAPGGVINRFFPRALAQRSLFDRSVGERFVWRCRKQEKALTMSGKRQDDFFQSVKNEYPRYFSDRLVLDVGSCDIDGNNQRFFDDCLYIGVDSKPGKNVDIAVAGYELKLPDECADAIISSGYLSRDPFYSSTLKNAVRMLKPGGLLAFTSSTAGVDEAEVRAGLELEANFQTYILTRDEESGELRFFGVKNGVLLDRQDYSFQLRTLGSGRLKSSEDYIADLLKEICERDRQIDDMRSSPSWRLTKPLRRAGDLIKDGPADAAKRVLNYLKRGAKKVTRPLRRRMLAGFWEDLEDRVSRIKKRDRASWGILATPHVLPMARLIADRLRSHGWEVEILTEPPTVFYRDMYIVIAAQIFKRLPPSNKRIVFQVEQSVSSRWFTSSYFKTLHESLAILEYSLVNVKFLAEKNIAFPRVHYLPIGATDDSCILSLSQKKYDVLFYGDCLSSPRRREMLDALKRRFKVHIASEVFGETMSEIIRQSKLVINLHYYPNALLETPRIQECLSLGTPVVSESAQDQDDYPELNGAVRFFVQGSISAMLEAVESALADPIPSEAISISVEKSARRFEFMFDRFLMAMGFLPASYAAKVKFPSPIASERLSLSLPETIQRRKLFEEERPANCELFDGMRGKPGWVGCGLSYNVIARQALRQNLDRIAVMEDDVLLPPNFEGQMAIINEFLDLHKGEWDVFAGVIAILNRNVKVLAVERFKGVTFVTIDKMVSMVFNVYGKKTLEILAAWSPENRDPSHNTIDRFLERQTDLRVVVTLPFFVGHREEMHSTLWGVSNEVYNDKIARSERLLALKVAAFESAPQESRTNRAAG